MCEHLELVDRPGRRPVSPGSPGCLECLRSGDAWVHLRLCMTCGHVGCCDDSPNRHATRHFHETHHPVVKSYEPGEAWAWCYLDDEMADEISASGAESPPQHLAPPPRSGSGA